MLYIMRHGRTDWNVRHKLQGRTDIPLNDEGRMMAAEAGKSMQIYILMSVIHHLWQEQKRPPRFFSKEGEYLYIQMTGLLRWDLEYMRE